MRWLYRLVVLLGASAIAAAWSSAPLRSRDSSWLAAGARHTARASKDGDIDESVGPPRPLVVFRPPSRHTYGFVQDGCYDLPRIELRALLTATADCKEVRFVPAGTSLQSADDVHHPPTKKMTKPKPMSKQQTKKKRASNSAHDVPLLYWIERGDGISLEDIVRAAHRAVLTHATFSIYDAVSCSEGFWNGAVSGGSSTDHPCSKMLGQMDVVDMNNPNMSRADRSQLIETVSCTLQNKQDVMQTLQMMQTNAVDTTMALIHHEEKEGVHHLYFGYRTAVGPAGTRGAPSQTLRRTHRGLLKEYALKKRRAVTDDLLERSNTSTAMEPEIGFLMVNQALAGVDGKRTRVLDPCCGSGRLLLYAAGLGATKLVGVDSDPGVWKGAEDEFRSHYAIGGKSLLAAPTFLHGNIMDPSSAEVLCTPESFEAIICDPPYNVGAPVLLDGVDRRPQNYHRDGHTFVGLECDESSQASTDLVPHLLGIARTVLVSGGRIVFFLPVRGEEQSMPLEEVLMSRGWRHNKTRGGHEDDLVPETLRLLSDSSRRQRFSPTFSRWAVCMEKK